MARTMRSDPLSTEMTFRNLMERGFTPCSCRYFTMVTRLPPVAFMGSAKNRSLPFRLPRSK